MRHIWKLKRALLIIIPGKGRKAEMLQETRTFGQPGYDGDLFGLKTRILGTWKYRLTSQRFNKTEHLILPGWEKMGSHLCLMWRRLRITHWKIIYFFIFPQLQYVNKTLHFWYARKFVARKRNKWHGCSLMCNNRLPWDRLICAVLSW